MLPWRQDIRRLNSYRRQLLTPSANATAPVAVKLGGIDSRRLAAFCTYKGVRLPKPQSYGDERTLNLGQRRGGLVVFET